MPHQLPSIFLYICYFFSFLDRTDMAFVSQRKVSRWCKIWLRCWVAMDLRNACMARTLLDEAREREREREVEAECFVVDILIDWWNWIDLYFVWMSLCVRVSVCVCVCVCVRSSRGSSAICVLSLVLLLSYHVSCLFFFFFLSFVSIARLCFIHSNS